MEAIIPYLVLLALPAGYFISRHTKPELKDGKKFFTLIQASAIAATIAIILLPWHVFGALGLAAIAFALALFVNNPLLVFPLFGLATAYNSSIAALAIIYTIPTTSKKYPSKKILIFSAILFLAAYHFSLLILR